jgi:maltose alpha-D-glucosyltransferase/alpha-amylase
MVKTGASPTPSDLPLLPTISIAGAWDWDKVAGPKRATDLTAGLAAMITTRRWFGAKTRSIRTLRFVDAIAIQPDVRLVLAHVDFVQGPAEVYQIPLALARGSKAEQLSSERPASLWGRVSLDHGPEPAVLYDPLGDAEFCQALLSLFDSQAALRGAAGELVAWQAKPFRKLRGDVEVQLPARGVDAEQSNSSVVYGERLVLKLFRRVEMGLNPDLEITARLTERGFAHVPPLAGGLEYRRSGHEPWTLGMLQGFVANHGDAWRYTLAGLERFLAEKALGRSESAEILPLSPGGMCDVAARPMAPAVVRTFGKFLTDAERLGARTAQLHRELAAETDDPAFAPEPFSIADQRSFCARANDLARETFELLRGQLPRLNDDTKRLAEEVLPLEGVAYERFDRIAKGRVAVSKIRCHGDYHLGQVLVASDDFMIIDFEGEPSRPLAERRRKQLALRDLAGMIRSFHYAACTSATAVKNKVTDPNAHQIENWTRAWYSWMSVTFLAAYQRTAAAAVFVPSSREEFQRVLDGCLLEKAIYELRYELNNRPDWVYLPLEALTDLLRAESANQ